MEDAKYKKLNASGDSGEKIMEIPTLEAAESRLQLSTKVSNSIFFGQKQNLPSLEKLQVGTYHLSRKYNANLEKQTNVALELPFYRKAIMCVERKGKLKHDYISILCAKPYITSRHQATIQI